MSSKTSKKQAIDKNQLLTDKIIKLMEDGVKPWVKPWYSIGYQNLISGHQYRGVNPMLCAVDSMIYDYNSPYFVGYQQAKERGWIVKKGSKSTWLRWGGTFAKETEAEDGTTSKEFFSCAKWLQVFNSDCLDDSEARNKIADHVKTLPAPNKAPRIMTADKFVEAQRATIKHIGSTACYSPLSDSIAMPAYEDFISAEGYYATLIHELTHWTGHSSRCDRDLSGRFGTQKYAYEELIAELGAAFTCNTLGISSAIENHASYLDNWLSVLKGDNKAFLRASSAATKASMFLLANAGLIEEESDQSQSA